MVVVALDSASERTSGRLERHSHITGFVRSYNGRKLACSAPICVGPQRANSGKAMGDSTAARIIQ